MEYRRSSWANCSGPQLDLERRVHLVTLVALSMTQKAEICAAVLAKYDPELEAGVIVSAEAGPFRVHLAP